MVHASSSQMPATDAETFRASIDLRFEDTKERPSGKRGSMARIPSFKFWLSNRTVVAPDSGGSQKVRLYRFPLGGAAVDVLSGFAEPAGVTISKARSR